MDIDDRAHASQEDEGMMPGMSPQDPLTYDPTQGAGTPAWQLAVQKQRELNARMGLETNARYRRN